MTFSLHSMVRFLVVLAVGSTILAVGVSRLAPPAQALRRPSRVTMINLNENDFSGDDRQPRWVDPATDATTTVPIDPGDLLEASSCSPWVDESGKRQIIGRWSSRIMHGPGMISQAFGLGRLSFPDGQWLNKIPSEIVPVGPPCWFPGTQARILFAAGDGQLYRFQFEPAVPTSDSLIDPAEPADLEPTPLTWGCPKPGLGDVFIGDISWPEESGREGRLLASIRIQYLDAQRQMRFTRSQIWALKLDGAGTQILDARPLIEHDLSGEFASQADERSPIMARTPAGSLVFAFTRQREGLTGWSVCMVKLATDADGHLVPGRESQVRMVEVRRQPASLAFSADGDCLNVLDRKSATAHRIVRLPLTDAPPTRPGADLGPLARTR